MEILKFGRKYVLSVETNEINAITGQRSVITISNPFTLEFDIVRNILGSANNATLRIFNLSAVNRNLLRKNVYDYGVNRKVVLMAGYGNNLSMAFAGNVMQCWSTRQGNNFITQIEALDGGFAFQNGKVNTAFAEGTAFTSVLASMAKNMPGCSVGAIGNYGGNLTRGNSYSGNTADILKEITGGGFFVDNLKVNCLNDEEYIAGQIYIVNAQSGLLGTPMLENNLVHFDIIFEPQIYVGQQIQLESISATANFNGFYKIIGVKHRGMISDAVAGDAVTTLSMFQPEALVPVQSRSA